MLLTHFGKNFVRENFLEKMFEFNCILTKKRVFDKKVAKYIFYIAVSSFTPNQLHRTQNALFKFLM
nr:MAG TPA: hypothetical protein [Caudoviricetes sp.]